MKPLWIFLIALVLILLGYFLFFNTEPATAPADTAELDASPTDAGGASAGVAVVSYDESTFSPQTITVPVGTTVSWVSEGADMWVASANHPTHTIYNDSSLSEHCVNGAPAGPDIFDQCSASGSFSFTFTKTGTWNYHDHANASARGTVVVTDAQ